MCGACEKREGLSPVKRKAICCVLSFAGPGLMLVAQFVIVWGGAFSFRNWSGPLTNEGGSLTGLTRMVQIQGTDVSLPPLAVPPSSFKVTVTSAMPKASGAV